MATAAPAKKKTQPKKPYPDFPLFPHARGYWAKKIRGKLYYFDRWENPDAALQQYLDQRDDLYAGRKPRAAGEGGVSLRELCNVILTAKQSMVDSGELCNRHFQDLHRICGRYSRAQLLLAELADQTAGAHAFPARRLPTRTGRQHRGSCGEACQRAFQLVLALGATE